MLRYSILLLLVNIYGRSLGGPVPEQGSNGKILIGNLLGELSKTCTNEFVLRKIESIKSTCNLEMDYLVPNLQCLMFFEANNILCNVTANLTSDFPAKIQEVQHASAFCNETANFTMPPLKYQKILTAVFRDPNHCTKVCSTDDIRTDDANFFCKYYKWSLLKLQALQISVHESAPTVSTGSATSGEVNKLKKTSNSADTNTQLVKEEETDTQTSAVANSTVQVTQHSANPESSSNVINTNKSTDKPVVIVKPADIGDVDAVDEDNDDVIETSIDNNVGENRDPDPDTHQIETPKGNKNEELDDLGLIDDEGRDGNDDGDHGFNTGARHEQERKPQKGADTEITLIGDGVQRDNLMGDGFTEDDHFFPFFLTAVIVVVVLYVLYHNKNKVGKMFFGLIVEGRQPGRRRNSRGHAYRRLDTLEQAMSANTPAPPSKIIY